MLAVISDTHRRDHPGLTGRTRNAVRTADAVVHAGDFTSVGVLDRLEGTVPSLIAVFGNADDRAVRDRLPRDRTFVWNGLRIAVVHRRRVGMTGLRLFGLERDADLVVFGHTHRPSVVETDQVALLNPGSPTDPRGAPPTHAEITTTESGMHIGIYRPDGTEERSVSIAVTG